MKKIVTKKWLIEQHRCGVSYWDQWVFSEIKSLSIVDAVKLLITKGKYDWGNWLVIQGMTRKQYIQYGVYAAKQVLNLYEKQYPDDKRPREAINAAIKCIEKDTKKNRDACAAAGAAANAAAGAAARTAGAAARTAAWAASNASDASATIATSAAWAAGAVASDGMRKKILQYGLKILKN